MRADLLAALKPRRSSDDQHIGQGRERPHANHRAESTRKDDRLDARTLARLARIDPKLLGPVRHRSAKAKSHLTAIRARATLVSARMALVNAARGLTKSFGERLAKCGTEQMNR